MAVEDPVKDLSGAPSPQQPAPGLEQVQAEEAKNYVIFRDGLLSRSPEALRQYMKREKGTNLPVGALKLLFNAAGKPVPAELQAAATDTYSLPRKELANLVYAAQKKQGRGFVPRTAAWLKIRLA